MVDEDELGQCSRTSFESQKAYLFDSWDADDESEEVVAIRRLMLRRLIVLANNTVLEEVRDVSN
jgi:hypothetical protein